MTTNSPIIKTNFTIRCGLRGLGACFAAAFASSALQLKGLLPLTYEPAKIHETVAVAGAWAGAAAGVLLGLGILPFPMLALCCLFYFGLMQVGDHFYNFQWDMLLLEAGVLGLFLCGRGTPPLAIWLPRLLVFKLMFRSGLVKIWSKDPAWANLDAMAYHFETQPLPGPTSWFAHHLPHATLQGLTAMTLALELVVPWLIFLGRKPRAAAAAAFILLQLGILATGNYGFFNVLTAVLCIFLLDDRMLRRGVTFSPPPLPWRRLLTAVALPLSIYFGNSYGLFAVMTTERREIEISGSNDGREWKTYDLPYKPGDPGRLPPFVPFHMPRLDWQLWFAALGTYQNNPWTLKLMEGLLIGDERVLALFRRNPFPGKPPAFVRADFHRYTFTSPEARAAGEGWWHRVALPPFLPPLSLKPRESKP